MKKYTCALILFLFIAASGFCQNDKNGKASPVEKLDTLALLRELEVGACDCVDKIPTAGKGNAELTDSIANCIKVSMGAFNLALQLQQALQVMQENQVTNSTPVNMGSYRNKMEFWLRDSCPAVAKKMSSNEKVSENSYSKNDDAIAEFNQGITYSRTQDWENALVHYKKAVAIDPLFGFAWDNLGVTNRRLRNWDDAIFAYRRSLAIDPRGLTALHNLPVVYQLKKDFDTAIIEFRHLASVFPEDPEAYYGAGNVYIFDKADLETGLDYMCKAFNLYGKLNSPYRVDAQKRIADVYQKMKAAGKEDAFDKILKDNNINYTK